jgi:rhamnogalacturonyl hydrolase YesR
MHQSFAISKSGMLVFFILIPVITFAQLTGENVLEIICKVNDRWQTTHPDHKSAFWDYAAYHTGNMEAYSLTQKKQYLQYSEDWAEFCEWKGAKSDNKSAWKYQKYGESDDYVLFGDWQACFQTYIDLYNLYPENKRIARAAEVMEYQINTEAVDYLWWVDGLYMVMPVLTKLYLLTKDERYLDKLYLYWEYANNIMWDEDEKLYYRDVNFIYPKHKTANGKKDFWSRGNGWAFAALAKVLQDLPENHFYRNAYINYFTSMAEALIACQQADGHWTRSLIDPEYAPGYETSGSAFFTYGLFWGINKGYLNREKYLPSALQGWKYLSTIALQQDGRVGYIQPIGSRADPNETVDVKSSWNFGMGAFLMAACEVYRYLESETNIVNKSTDESKNLVRYIKNTNSLQIKLNPGIVDQKIKAALFNRNGSVLLKKDVQGENTIDISLNTLRLNGVFLLNISDQTTALNENIKVLIY